MLEISRNASNMSIKILHGDIRSLTEIEGQNVVRRRRARGGTQHSAMKELLVAGIFYSYLCVGSAGRVCGWRGPGLIIQSVCLACHSLSSDSTLWGDGPLGVMVRGCAFL